MMKKVKKYKDGISVADFSFYLRLLSGSTEYLQRENLFCEPKNSQLSVL
jgi:hypothetical protein